MRPQHQATVALAATLAKTAEAKAATQDADAHARATGRALTAQHVICIVADTARQMAHVTLASVIQATMGQIAQLAQADTMIMALAPAWQMVA